MRKPVRLPIPLAEAAEKHAQACGMTFNDFCARLLSDHLHEQGIEVDYDFPIQEQLMTA